VESVYSVAFHTLLSVQNIVFLLVYYLNQKLLNTKNLSRIKSVALCLFQNEENVGEEENFFVQYSFLYLNNLIQVHLHHFKKVYPKFSLIFILF